MLRLNTVLAALGCATLGCSSEDSRPPPLVDCPTDAACSAGYRPPLAGGFGSAVIEYLNELEMPHVRIRRIGIPDIFIEQGKQTELRKKYGLDEEGIYQAVLSISKEPSYTV